MERLFRSELGQSRVHEQYRSMLRAWSVPYTEIRLPTCQGETFVLVSGPDTAPALVLLHGGGTTSVMWGRNLSRWASRFRVFAVDIIGEPGFSAPSRVALTSDGHARWLDDVWRGLSLTNASLVGASFGGLLALDYAIRRPERVLALALLAPAGVSGVRLSYLIRAIPLFLLGARGRRKAFDFVMGLRPEETSEDTDAFIRLSELVMAHFSIRMQRLPVFTDRQLSTVTIPVLAVVGSRDVVFRSSRTRKRLEACCPQARVEMLSGVGHGLTDQTETVLDFLLSANGLSEASAVVG